MWCSWLLWVLIAQRLSNTDSGLKYCLHIVLLDDGVHNLQFCRHVVSTTNLGLVWYCLHHNQLHHQHWTGRAWCRQWWITQNNWINHGHYHCYQVFVFHAACWSNFSTCQYYFPHFGRDWLVYDCLTHLHHWLCNILFLDWIEPVLGVHQQHSRTNEIFLQWSSEQHGNLRQDDIKRRRSWSLLQCSCRKSSSLYLFLRCHPIRLLVGSGGVRHRWVPAWWKQIVKRNPLVLLLTSNLLVRDPPIEHVDSHNGRVVHWKQRKEEDAAIEEPSSTSAWQHVDEWCHQGQEEDQVPGCCSF